MGVDFPDGHKLSIIKGWDGTTFRNIKVAADGTMYILVSALTNSTLIPLKSDSLGNLLLNIKAQDLAEVINRPKYGGAITGAYYDQVTASAVTTLLTVTGKGMIYGGFVLSEGVATQGNDYVYLDFDGERVGWNTFNEMLKYGLLKPHTSVPYLICFDGTNFYYAVGLCYGYTFETFFEVYYQETHGRTPWVTADIHYAVI